jgi:hypothetical protein
MKNYKYYLIIVAVIIVAFGFWNLKHQNQKTSIQNEKVVQEFKADLTINDDKTNPSFNITQYIGKTALEATQIVLSGNVKMTGENDKAFVTGINGLNADPKKYEFWELLVNGKQAEVGAGSYKIQNFDNIVWKISKFK